MPTITITITTDEAHADEARNVAHRTVDNISEDLYDATSSEPVAKVTVHEAEPTDSNVRTGLFPSDTDTVVTFNPYVFVKVTDGVVTGISADWHDTYQNALRDGTQLPDNHPDVSTATTFLDRDDVRSAVVHALRSAIGNPTT
jgi:hypothetical protein